MSARLAVLVAVLPVLAVLEGCNTLRVPREVRVPVPVACIEAADRPKRPELMTDGEIKALDAYRATWALWGDRAARQAYEAQLEAVVEGCSKLPAMKPP